MNPDYPVYIVSKGRWESRITSRALERINVPYYIIVEQDEYEQYAEVISPLKILILPKDYLDTYDTFDNGIINKSKGPGAARNFAWDHSIQHNHKWHWVMDDNINGFERLNKNERNKVTSGTIFKCAEDFVNRYENVALSGFEYRQFGGGARRKKSPFRLNTRIYSCILIRNDIPYRWRGRYNEDTDLSLRALKDGWCTILFQCFLQNKAGTMQIKGGNTKDFYDIEGTYNKSTMLKDMHPDVADVVWRYGRWHHDVNYDVFKDNKLIRKEGLIIPDRVNNYGMILGEL